MDLTLKIQDAYDREVSALMVGQRTANLDDLRTKVYDLLLVGLKHSGSNFNVNGVLDDYFNKLPKLISDTGFNSTSTCLTLSEKSYDIAGFYHTHPIGGPEPSGGFSMYKGSIIPSGDMYIYNHFNLPRYIKGTNGWSTVAPDGKGKIQYDPNLKIEKYQK